MNQEGQNPDQQKREHQNQASLENHTIPAPISFTALILYLLLWQFVMSNLADFHAFITVQKL